MTVMKEVYQIVDSVCYGWWYGGLSIPISFHFSCTSLTVFCCKFLELCPPSFSSSIYGTVWKKGKKKKTLGEDSSANDKWY